MSTKIIIKIRKEVEQEIEKNIGYYEHGWQFYNIKSDTNYLSVSDPEYRRKGIEIGNDKDLVEYVLMFGKESTKEKFQEHLLKALDHINHAAFMETAEPVNNEIFELNEGLQTSLNSLI